MISEASERLPATKSAFYFYVENADAAVDKAVSSGAAKMFEPTNMPY
jgi:PhnB protein